MNQSEIKRKRTESLLKELLPEAFSMLDDEMLKNLVVTEVVCSRGRYDSKVYLDKSGIDEESQKEILKRLQKVAGFLKNYVKESAGWYKSPNFKFEFDDHLEHIKRIDNLFKQIKKD
ncbi:MAG: 30S ribosome-binding factor RbfA [Epsilonproteobacteria bacterium]|nr:30S ribosome-binding factor RbfA [Campylobacterota bacterium]